MVLQLNELNVFLEVWVKYFVRIRKEKLVDHKEGEPHSPGVFVLWKRSKKLPKADDIGSVSWNLSRNVTDRKPSEGKEADSSLLKDKKFEKTSRKYLTNKALECLED